MSPKGSVREAGRALVLAPSHRVLLLQYDVPRSGGVRWLTPGGRRTGGESAEECVRRELAEETGLRDFEVGPLIWRRTISARRLQSREQFFLVRIPEFPPSAKRMGRRERSVFRGFRWWSADEIDGSTDRFEPGQLAHFLEMLLAEGAPERPVEVGR